MLQISLLPKQLNRLRKERVEGKCCDKIKDSLQGKKREFISKALCAAADSCRQPISGLKAKTPHFSKQESIPAKKED